MVGTRAGSLKAKQTMLAKYGEEGYREFYRRVGSLGGSVKNPNRGFACKEKDANGLTGRDRARLAGALGGLNSTRGAQLRDAAGKAIRKTDGKPWGSPRGDEK